MIENKDIPNEFVSIRQVWLRQINRCCENMSNRYKVDITIDGGYSNVNDVGIALVIESVDVLYYSLIDYGEATIKTDVKNWKENVMYKVKDLNKKKLEWYRKFFEYIIETLNRYGMLFDTKTQGYSNVEMKSV